MCRVLSRWVRTTERFGAPANFFQEPFEFLKLVRGQLREDFFDICRVLSKHRNNEFLTAWGQRNDPDATVLSAFNTAYQPLRIETINRDTNRSWGEIHLRSDRIYGKRSLVQEHFKNPKV